MKQKRRKPEVFTAKSSLCQPPPVKLPIVTGPMAEHFRCEPYRCVITRIECARRHRAWSERKMTADNVRVASHCAACPVGREHARGKPAKGVLSVRLVAASSEQKRVKFCVTCGAVLEPGKHVGRYCNEACKEGYGNEISVEDAPPSIDPDAVRHL
jgi:hypothetical protein